MGASAAELDLWKIVDEAAVLGLGAGPAGRGVVISTAPLPRKRRRDRAWGGNGRRRTCGRCGADAPIELGALGHATTENFPRFVAVAACLINGMRTVWRKGVRVDTCLPGQSRWMVRGSDYGHAFEDTKLAFRKET
ncbi:hypothetical protein Cob_v000094 [Colletotrichum orbiculare MAFF 240422]|uniref:Uncharacterized protein n=1 Tax=Colletotrichum orbiculare (strain 104-T / ATCC 96160 / CBS 514.97 / LARS 414 / MAFF 240422) TaxID=1213857 RepID=A0A484G7Y3_COLOR|nr:hypothetical protein Cob_v000094 [Colletotrichum orbiculare MAFF 240422]